MHSRRLGLSLGVDIVPFKICTLDCIYCQLGGTVEKTIQRRKYVPIEAILAELKDRAADRLQADFITIGGCGEPTLNSGFGQLVEGIKKITDIPVAVLTNGTLLYREDVRRQCAKADVVLPSLDAADQETFEKINRPHTGISIEKLISGLVAFRNEFTGQIWLEVFLVDGLNTDAGQLAKIKEAVKRIRPDKVQLNTAVRPTAVAEVRAVNAERLEAIAKEFGKSCEVISCLAPQGRKGMLRRYEDLETVDRLLSILKRRPCTLEQLSLALRLSRNEVLKHIDSLQKRGAVDSKRSGGVTFFKSY